jgi:hypothetical protein
MGGRGSGRWRGHRKMQLADNCRALDLALFAEAGVLLPGATGTLSWRGLAIGYAVRSMGDGLALLLGHTWQPLLSPTSATVEQTITLARFPVRSWRMHCPLSVNGRPCGRRVLMLYLPPGGHYFGCRRCHALTYKSAQTHDKRDRKGFWWSLMGGRLPWWTHLDRKREKARITR